MMRPAAKHPTTRDFDFVIVGQGLAGSTLAWQLYWLGQNLAIIDREAPTTASKVASGLISPVTGKRNVASWKFDQLWHVAKQFYERVELETKTNFFHRRPMLKIVDEVDSTTATAYAGCRARLNEPLNTKLSAVECAPAGRLDVNAYLDASRATFASLNAYFIGDVDLKSDIELDGKWVRLPRFAIRSRNIVFCQGIDAQSNSWFPDVQFEPAKGEILTIEMPGHSEERVVAGEVWLAPQDDGLFLVGSTYEREFHDLDPTDKGRDEILDKLSKFAPGEHRIVDHRAASRPVVRGRLPVVGMHRSLPLGYFNGLGSKGSLRAPFVAKQFAEFLVNGGSILDEIRLDVTEERATPRRLTELAHRRVASVLADGAMAIDATAGNGLDTVFLANSVGGTGHVFAVDVQAVAIQRTRARLAADDIKNVTLSLGSHAQLWTMIPKTYHGQVSAIMFNLGYLPRGNKEVVTQTESTIAAITGGLELLNPGGMMTVLAYTGHPGGLEEALAIEKTLRDLDCLDFEVELPTAPLEAGPPRLYVVERKGAMAAADSP